MPQRSACELAARGSLASRLGLFYQQHAPEKLQQAAQVARMFEGREDKLDKCLRARFGTGLEQEEAAEGKAASSSLSSAFVSPVPPMPIPPAPPMPDDSDDPDGGVDVAT